MWSRLPPNQKERHHQAKIMLTESRMRQRMKVSLQAWIVVRTMESLMKMRLLRLRMESLMKMRLLRLKLQEASRIRKENIIYDMDIVKVLDICVHAWRGFCAKIRKRRRIITNVAAHSAMVTRTFVLVLHVWGYRAMTKSYQHYIILQKRLRARQTICRHCIRVLSNNRCLNRANKRSLFK